MNEDEVVVRVRVDAGEDPRGDAPDIAAAVLWAHGATAVEVNDDPEGTTLLAGYPTAAAARRVAARLAGSLGATAERVTDTSWRDAWRAWVQPVPVGDRLLVVPAWQKVPLRSARLTVEIDPGPCFGSGTHASTRMLLGWLDAHPPVASSVIDVGTGSGILAVAAGRLGAGSVLAVDIDPAAVAVTRANAARNGVANVIEASTALASDLPASAADLVLVNVTAGVHAVIGAHCAGAVRPGGTLVASGLLPGQWEHVAGAYADLTMVESLQLDGWEGTHLHRSGVMPETFRNVSSLS
jgi:ribosomal protein L11 methyltransferase